MWKNSFVLLFVVGSIGTAGQSPPGDRLAVEIAPSRQSFESPRDVRIRLTVTPTGGDDCQPVLIDRVIAPAKSPARPAVVVKFELRDELGRRVPRDARAPGTALKFQAVDFLLLNCHHHYGVDVYLARAPWFYRLAHGTYTAQASVELDARSFFSRNQEFRGALGYPPGIVDELLTDGRYTAAAISFRVGSE